MSECVGRFTMWNACDEALRPMPAIAFEISSPTSRASLKRRSAAIRSSGSPIVRSITSNTRRHEGTSVATPAVSQIS